MKIDFFSPEELPLRELDNLFTYEKFCRDLESIDDPKYLLDHLSTELRDAPKTNSATIERTFLLERVYRLIGDITDKYKYKNDDNTLEFLKGVERYFMRCRLNGEERLNNLNYNVENTHDEN